MLIFASNQDVVDAALKAWAWGIVWRVITVLVALLVVAVGKGGDGNIN